MGMSFKIHIQNDASEGTIHVFERVDSNNNKEIFNDVIPANGIQDVTCLGTAPKDFTWRHDGTGLSGGPQSIDDDGTLRVS
jgi:hypothetical protein